MAYKSKAERGQTAGRPAMLRADRRYAVYENFAGCSQNGTPRTISLCGDIWHDLAAPAPVCFCLRRRRTVMRRRTGKTGIHSPCQECLYARACAGNVDGLVAAAKEFGADAELSDIRRTLRDAARTVDGEIAVSGQTSGQ